MDMMLEQFKTIFDRPEKVKKLRETILDLAVRGKLVPQNPNDEPASVLLERIREEKERLIKEKKIKKEKPLAEISEREKVFELPEGWELTRIGEIITLKGGKRLPKGYSLLEEETSHVYIRITDMKRGSIKNYDLRYISDGVYEKIKNYIITKDDLYITIAGTIGEVGIVPDKFHNMNLTENAARIIPYKVNKFWLKSFIESTFIQRILLDKVNQMAQPKLALKRIQDTIIPVPPLTEQKRIVEKINLLMSFCDKLEKALEKKVNYGKLSAKSVFNSVGNVSTVEELEETLKFILLNFKDLSLGDNAVKELKNCILQLAVQGKLVPQDPNDEPAEVLLGKIREEKETLIKEKKIKREKPLVEINEEEKPFELPCGWSWIRLGEYCLLNPRNSVEDSLDTSFVPMKLINDGFDNKHSFESKKWKEIKSGFTHFAENDIVVAKITPCFENRKSCIMKGLINDVGAGTTELYVVRCLEYTILPEFVLSVFKTENFINGGIQTYTGTAGQQRVKKDYINNLVVAIPPLEEQKRIVEKVDSLMELCDKLEKRIKKQKEYSSRLMEVVIKNI